VLRLAKLLQKASIATVCEIFLVALGIIELKLGELLLLRLFERSIKQSNSSSLPLDVNFLTGSQTIDI